MECHGQRVMLTILTTPERTKHSRTTHIIKKFKVPEYVVELLKGLPLVVGFGIWGDVLAIEDMFSLLAGQSLKLCGFVELGSLLLHAGWGLRTCNMPSVHTITTGSVLNKVVSSADKSWGKPWEEISSSLMVYAIGDI